MDSRLSPLSCTGGSICHSSKDKADLLTYVFHSKQCNKELNLLPSFPQDIKLGSIAIKSYDGYDPLGFLSLLYKKTASLLVQKLAVIFRALLRNVLFRYAGI